MSEIGDMYLEYLSSQKYSSGRNVRKYTQHKYTF